MGAIQIMQHQNTHAQSQGCTCEHMHRMHTRQGRCNHVATQEMPAAGAQPASTSSSQLDLVRLASQGCSVTKPQCHGSHLLVLSVHKALELGVVLVVEGQALGVGVDDLGVRRVLVPAGAKEHPIQGQAPVLLIPAWNKEQAEVLYSE